MIIHINNNFIFHLRSDTHTTHKQEPIKIYPQRSPVYVPSKRISNKQGNGYDDQIPSKGEVVIEDRFTLSRPLFSYEALKKTPENNYLPPPKYSDSKPELPPKKDSSNDNTNVDVNPPPASYDSPYNSYNPPDRPPVYVYSKPSSSQKPYYPPTMPPKEDSTNNSDSNPPSASYDSPYNSYNAPNAPPSYYYPKPDSNNKPSIYPPYVDLPKNENKMKDKEKVPYLEYKPPTKTLPEYLDYNPDEHKHNHDHEHDHNQNHEHNHDHDQNHDHNHDHDQNHDHNHDHDDHSMTDDMQMMKPPKIPEYLDYDPHSHHHHHDNPIEISSPDSEDTKSNKKPEFPSYLYHPPPTMKEETIKDPFPPGIPPYLEYDPYQHKGNENGPPITATVAPPSGDSDVHYAKFPEYIDHDAHHFPDFYHYPHVYHEIKPLTTTAAPAPEEKRVNKRPYTYYYIGRKLWYIPLYFSLYFIVYVFVLVLKSIARHKITFNHYFEEDRKFNGEPKMENLTEHVLTSIEDATQKYSD